jgi:hypothetical protein
LVKLSCCKKILWKKYSLRVHFEIIW